MSKVEETSKTRLSKYMCLDCGWIYDPALGDKKNGIPPGTPFDQIPDKWKCPACKSAKKNFAQLD